MKQLFLSVIAALTLTACAPAVPDSGSGVGFGDYASYQARREAELLGQVPPRQNSSGQNTSGPNGPRLNSAASVTASALNAEGRAVTAAADANSGFVPINASPSNPAPQVVANAAGISEENNFDAVSNERSIGDDAALIARNRAQYEIVQPTALPSRTGNTGPNVVEYALRTTNPRGVALYRRSSFGSEAKAQRACASYASAELAQESFLESGGPERDRKGLDPDGDGYACTWDPAPFRRVRGS